MQIFCEGIGTDFADITGASRAMKASEWELCKQNGVTNVTEILLGYDGLSMAVSQKGEALDVSKAQLFSALAAEVEVDGEVVANPYQRWSEIDPALPDIPILVYGPPPTSGTRDAWVELVMHGGLRRVRRRSRRCPRSAWRRSASACAPTARSSRPARTTT